MKALLLILSFILPSGSSSALQEPSADQMKSDLIGKSMGGREKGWKFQSLDQIQDLTIQAKKEEANRRVYTITLKLQDPRVSESYSAEADVTYEKVDAEWKVKVVGLRSMKKVEP